MWQHTTQEPALTMRRLIGGVTAAMAASMAVVVSAWRDESALGAPPMWP